MTRFAKAASAAMLLSFTVGQAMASDLVRVATLDESVVFHGIILSDDHETIRVLGPFGEADILKSMITCEGAACPDDMKSALRLRKQAASPEV